MNFNGGRPLVTASVRRARFRLYNHVLSKLACLSSLPLGFRSDSSDVPLPLEILEHIFSFLDPSTLCSVSESSVAFYELSSNSHVWGALFRNLAEPLGINFCGSQDKVAFSYLHGVAPAISESLRNLLILEDFDHSELECSRARKEVEDLFLRKFRIQCPWEHTSSRDRFKLGSN